MINDPAAGLGEKVVAVTPRDSLYVLDVRYDRDGGKRPEAIVIGTARTATSFSGSSPWPGSRTRRGSLIRRARRCGASTAHGLPLGTGQLLELGQQPGPVQRTLAQPLVQVQRAARRAGAGVRIPFEDGGRVAMAGQDTGEGHLGRDGGG